MCVCVVRNRLRAWIRWNWCHHCHTHSNSAYQHASLANVINHHENTYIFFFGTKFKMIGSNVFVVFGGSCRDQIYFQVHDYYSVVFFFLFFFHLGGGAVVATKPTYSVRFTHFNPLSVCSTASSVRTQKKKRTNVCDELQKAQNEYRINVCFTFGSELYPTLTDNGSSTRYTHTDTQNYSRTQPQLQLPQNKN